LPGAQGPQRLLRRSCSSPRCRSDFLRRPLLLILNSETGFCAAQFGIQHGRASTP
jgi:hypothetical protein